MRLTLDELLEIAQAGTEDQLPPDQLAQFRLFMRRARIRRGGETYSEEASGAAPSPGAATRPQVRKRWRLTAEVALVVVAVGATVAAILGFSRAADAERAARDVTTDRDRLAERLTAVEEELARLRRRQPNLPPGTDFPLDLKASKDNIPVGWQETLRVFFNPDDTPEENLTQLEKVSAGVRAEATRMRRAKPSASAKEILDALFKGWGYPNR